jgi:hypothetical protein
MTEQEMLLSKKQSILKEERLLEIHAETDITMGIMEF